MKTLLFATLATLTVASVAMIRTVPDEVQVKRLAEAERARKEGRPVPLVRDVKNLIPITWVSDQNPLRSEQVESFNRLNPKYDLRIDPGNGGPEKIIVQSAAGVGPDVFDFWGQNSRDAYVASGIAWDVTDELAKRGYDWKKEIWPLAHGWIAKNDRIYAIPANVGSDAMWYHRDMLRAAGIPEPKADWKLADMIEVAKKLTIRDKKGNIERFGVLIDFNGAFRHWLPSFGGSMFNKAGTEVTIDSPEAIACAQFCHDLIYKYKVAPSPSDESGMSTGGGQFGGAGPMAYFRRKLGAMAIGGRWWLAQLRTDVEKDGFDLGVADMPIAKYARFDGGTRAVMINSKSPRREEALDFLMYLAGPDYNVLLNDQADALSGGRKYAYTPRFMKNPAVPNERGNEVWRRAVERGVVLEYSPFVPVADTDDPLNRNIDLVKLNKKTPAAALKDAARDIRRTMKTFLSRNPALKERYEAVR